MDVPREIREAKIKDIYTDDKQREKVIKWILNYLLRQKCSWRFYQLANRQPRSSEKRRRRKYST